MTLVEQIVYNDGCERNSSGLSPPPEATPLAASEKASFRMETV